MSNALEPDTCGCCEKTETGKLKHYNPPGQKVISYRIGTHAFFMRRMLANLSSQSIPDNQGLQPQASLTARDPDDPSIALLDAWATAADVLTFYQERIASEGYLSTATERRSVLELARAIGYELNPGVAASTFLAFTVEDTPGSPGVTKVPKGTKVQNIPAQGKSAQTFETDEEFEARAEWNAFKPRLTQPQDVEIQDPNGLVYTNETQKVVNQLYFAGTDTKLKEGDLLLIAIRNDEDDLQTLLKRIKRLTIEYESNPRAETDTNLAIADRSKSGSTRVDFTDDIPSVTEFIPHEYESEEISQLFEFNDENIKKHILNRKWEEHEIRSFLTLNRWNEKDMLKHINALREKKHLGVDEGFFAFRQKIGFFGHNAPNYNSLPEDNFPGNNWDPDDGSGWEIWKDPLTGDYYSEADAYLERSLDSIIRGSWAVFETTKKISTEPCSVYRICDISGASLTGFGISGKATGLLLEKPDGTSLGNYCSLQNKRNDLKVRKTTAHIQSEKLELADMPVDEPVEEVNENGENTGATSLMLDRMVLGLRAGQPLALSGEQADAAGIIRNEIVILKDIIHMGGYTTLHFRDRLKYRYLRKTVTINANVVRATHGETVHEVLGSGDGSKANQRFTLKKSHLTHIVAPASGDVNSTLELRVSDVLWEEKPSLYDLDARGQHYIVRIDDDAKATIIFGDGNSGARLPSGTDNIVATYRSGTGKEGEGGPGSLTLLQTMPLGIKEVTNPLPSAGAKDPEKLEMARINAPRSAVTMDRIISLLDFEYFASSFGGIGKANAAALQDGEKHFVHITVAGENGKTLDSNLKTDFSNAVRAACDPMQQVEVGDFIRSTFSIKAKILVDRRYLFEDVRKEVERALLDNFSFEKRKFGQPVSKAEVLKVIHDVKLKVTHGVKAVIAVDLETLKKDTEASQQTEEAPAILTANNACIKDGKIQQAELLLINQVGVTLEKMEDWQ